MTTTEALITYLEGLARETGSWRITADELSDRYDAVDFYRALYEAAQVSTDEYGPNNVGELLVLLDTLTGRDYRSEFREAGLLLTYDHRIDLTERFVRAVRHAIVLHIPEPETFRAMLREFRRYDRAEFVYLETFLDTLPIVRRVAGEFVERRDAPALEATVASYLRLLLQRHVVDVHELAPALIEILQTVARHEGVLPQPRDDHEPEGPGGPGGRGSRASSGWDGYDRSSAAAGEITDRRAALRVLGVRGSNPSQAEIRTRYRTLMRTYHPDINPDGLEMAKRINSAYGLLVTGAAAP